MKNIVLALAVLAATPAVIANEEAAKDATTTEQAADAQAPAADAQAPADAEAKN